MADELDQGAVARYIARDIARDIALMADSQRRLADHLASIGDVDPAQPSNLSGWTLGHVLSHVARNADSMLRMLAGLPQYWGGFASRDADIQLGATRGWDVLVADVLTTGEAVERRMHEVTDWSGSVEATTGPRPKAILPLTRQREVEIHRVDLGLGYTFADMPAAYVRADIRQMTMRWAARQPMGMTTLPAGVLAVPEHARLAWLMGRSEIDGVPPAGVI